MELGAVASVLSVVNTAFLVGVAFGAGKAVQRLTHVERDIRAIKLILQGRPIDEKRGSTPIV